MKTIRRMTLSVAVALIGCAGCTSSSSRPARDINVAADPPYSEPIVILADIEGISDTADDGNPPYHRIKKSTFMTRPAGEFTFRTVPVSTSGFFWSYWGERQRWTFFSPGRASVTIYPDEGYTDVNGRFSYAARLADIRDGIQLAPNGPLLEESCDPDSGQVTLRLPPSAAPTIATVTRPLSISERNTFPPGLASTVLFGQQVRALKAALASAGPKALDNSSRRILSRAIEIQRDALFAARVLGPEDQSVAEAVLRVRRHQTESRQPAILTPRPLIVRRRSTGCTRVGS
jgi:hypothetical protein